MKLSAVDQLVVVSDGDSYAASMGITYPVNGGNAQYYLEDGDGKVTEVSPVFADESGRRLIFFPQLFSAAESRYLAADGLITFRFNSRTSDEAIIAQGTMEQFSNGPALRSGTWNTAAQGATAQTYAQVFKTGVMTLGEGANAIQVPILQIIGQLAYGRQLQGGDQRHQQRRRQRPGHQHQKRDHNPCSIAAAQRYGSGSGRQRRDVQVV